MAKGRLFQRTVETAETDKFRIVRFCMLLHGFFVGNLSVNFPRILKCLVNPVWQYKVESISFKKISKIVTFSHQCTRRRTLDGVYRTLLAAVIDVWATKQLDDRRRINIKSLKSHT